MKKTLFATLALFTIITTGYGVDDRKLPMLPLVSTNCQKEVVVEKGEQEVQYRCADTNLWSVFIADVSGKLKSLRIVLGDMTVYQWECQYVGEEIQMFDGPENGVHKDNKYRIDRKSWLRFYTDNIRMTVTGSAVEKPRIADPEFYLADGQNNGSPGGFTLLKVIDKQWDFLKSRGLKLHHLGNVLDTNWPKDFGPILMSEGYWLPDKDRFLKDTEEKPEVFWVAVRTDADTYKQK